MMRSVRITSDQHSASTKVLTDEGAPILGIAAIDVAIRPNDIVRAEILLAAAEVNVSAAVIFKVACPRTGRMRTVKRIEFDDGESVEF